MDGFFQKEKKIFVKLVGYTDCKTTERNIVIYDPGIYGDQLDISENCLQVPSKKRVYRCDAHVSMIKMHAICLLSRNVQDI